MPRFLEQQMQSFYKEQPCQAPFFLFMLQVDMVRRRTPVLLQVYLPSGLFVIVSWISFIVPPEVVPGKCPPSPLYCLLQAVSR